MKSLFSRRQFIQTAALASGSALLGAGTASAASGRFAPPVSVFTKVCQEVKLDFDQSAEVVAAAGLDGIDCAVRPGGEILPERAAEDMPRYAAALARHKIKMLLLTTAITGVSSPGGEAILRAGKKLGIQYYRLGYWNHRTNEDPAKFRAEIVAALKDLAAMNREIGVCAVFQNHSSAKTANRLAGGDLAELYDLIKDFNPDQVAVAFDLGHAILTHGDGWRPHFEKLKGHIKVAYVKDARRPSSFVPFGQGEFGAANFFPLLARMGYRAPLSMHIEYDWAPEGKKTREGLLKALKESRQVLGEWLAKA